MLSPGIYRRLILAWLSVNICVALAGTCFADEVIPPNPDYQWFKGNLHTHSLWSDGNDFPEMIAEWYRVRHYHFLALSDHNILSEGDQWVDANLPTERGNESALAKYQERFGTHWVQIRHHDGQRQVRLKPLNEFRALVEQRGKFILIQGEEISDSSEGLPVHVNASNPRDLIYPQGGSTVREALANNLQVISLQSRQTGRPILGHLNHPNFNYAFTAEDIAAVVQEQFFEVFNGHPSVNHRGDKLHASVERLWDIANTIRLARMKAAPLFGLATDDSHNYLGLAGSSPGRGWVMVRARHLTPESIIRALEAGDFYASSGVSLESIDFEPESGRVSIRISEKPGVTYTTDFIGTNTDYDAMSQPVKDEEGNEIRATRQYSKDVGKVLATVVGINPTYKLTGQELYVRATITASVKPDNPVFDDQLQQAWTQPIGWRKWLRP